MMPGVLQQSPDYPVCDRSTWGRLCGRPCLWQVPACLVHLTGEERVVRETLRPSMRDMTIALFRGREDAACWSRPVPAALPVFPTRDAADQYLSDWHEWQCAACGSLYPEVSDHDHDTGMVRGRLCRSCNVREGKAGTPLFRNYRQRNPASILGIGAQYWSPWTGYAEPQTETPLTGERTLRAAVDALRLPSPGEAGSG